MASDGSGAAPGPGAAARIRDAFRRLHREPMQHAAAATLLLAAWERACEAGDGDAARAAASLLASEVRAIGAALQSIERDGLAALDDATRGSQVREHPRPPCRE